MAIAPSLLGLSGGFTFHSLRLGVVDFAYQGTCFGGVCKQSNRDRTEALHLETSKVCSFRAFYIILPPITSAPKSSQLNLKI
jgi:hypothetical protein